MLEAVGGHLGATTVLLAPVLAALWVPSAQCYSLIQAGYALQGMVLRPAKVVLAEG